LGVAIRKRAADVSFPFSAVWVASEIGLSASLVLSTLPRPKFVRAVAAFARSERLFALTAVAFAVFCAAVATPVMRESLPWATVPAVVP
jgi:hypothetical protein